MMNCLRCADYAYHQYERLEFCVNRLQQDVNPSPRAMSARSGCLECASGEQVVSPNCAAINRFADKGTNLPRKLVIFNLPL